MKHSENTDYLPVFIAKMQSEGLPSPVVDTFAYYFNQLIQGETGLVYDRDIRPVEPDEIEQFHNLGNYAAAGIENFHQTVRIVLNGGLGTSMGLTGAKSLIKIKGGKSFLDVILKQAQNHAVTLAFMNSFSTHVPFLRSNLPGFPSFSSSTNFPRSFKKICLRLTGRKTRIWNGILPVMVMSIPPC